jgi:Fe2+ or Zn2+ uptake regulation protein
MKSKAIAELLKEHNIRPSYPRVKIYEYLLNNRIHPTVDEIYNTLKPDLYTLSKTTVYNTLDLFVENNLALLLTIDENNTRYDIKTDNHGHFKCRICNQVYDFEFSNYDIQFDSLENFEIEDEQLYLTGVCEHCKKEQKK